MHFDILNRLGVVVACDRRTDGQTEPGLAIARSNDPRYKRPTHTLELYVLFLFLSSRDEDSIIN